MAPFLNLFKVNPQTPGYERQAGGANKVNFFATNPLQKVSGGNAVGGSEGSGNTVGLHGNYKRGDEVSLSAQAGYDAHKARILGFV